MTDIKSQLYSLLGYQEEESEETSYLDDLEDGAGCTEIWEKLSEERSKLREEDLE